MEPHESAALQLTDQNFAAEVEEYDGVVLVDFWAEWCGPCRAMAPAIAEMAGKYKDRTDIKIAQLNVDENTESSTTYKILSIPNFKIFKGGKVVDEVIGRTDPAVLEQKVLQHATAA